MPSLRDLAPPTPEVRHEIVESYTDNATQAVRCSCGRSAMFGRDRDYMGNVRRARARAEFTCTGEHIVLLNALLREAE